MIQLNGTFAQSFDVDCPFAWGMVDEPDNKYDSNAVYVTLNGSNVGYVPRSANHKFRASTHYVSNARICVLRGRLSIFVHFSPLDKEQSGGEATAKRARSE